MMIEAEMSEAVKNTEKEVLMKIWIKELKEIITDFEKLKKAKPKEFTIQLNEIADTISLFKEKLSQ